MMGCKPRLPRHQGDELLVLLVVVCAGVVLLRLGAALAENHDLAAGHPRCRVAHANRIRSAVLVVASVVVDRARGGRAERTLGQLGHVQEPGLHRAAAGAQTSERFTSANGNGRYQYWKSSIDAFEDASGAAESAPARSSTGGRATRP